MVAEGLCPTPLEASASRFCSLPLRAGFPASGSFSCTCSYAGSGVQRSNVCHGLRKLLLYLLICRV